MLAGPSLPHQSVLQSAQLQQHVQLNLMITTGSLVFFTSLLHAPRSHGARTSNIFTKQVGRERIPGDSYE